MGPKLEKRSHARVNPSPKKTVTWADQLPKPKMVQSRCPKGEELKEALQYMRENNPYFCLFPGMERHEGQFLWRYVVLTKHMSKASQDVFEKYYALQRTKRVGEY